MLRTHGLKGLVPSVLLGAAPLVGAGCDRVDTVAADDAPHSHGAVGDDHAHPDDEEPTPEPVTVFTAELGLYLEYPLLVEGEQARFFVHLTRLASGEPLRAARVALELDDGGTTASFVAEGAEREGLFVPAGALPASAAYDARVSVEADGLSAVVPLGSLAVWPDRARAHAAAEDHGHGESSDGVSFSLEAQWRVGLRTAPVERRTLTARLDVPGTVELRPGAAAFVASPFAGILAAPEGGRLPLLGERVEAGQVLGAVELPLAVGDRAALLANGATYRSLELELAGRELELADAALAAELERASAETRLAFARGTFERLEALRAKGLGDVGELEAARRDVQLAEREIDGADARAVAVERARERVDGLRGDVAAAAAEVAAIAQGRVPLVAPIAGEVAALRGVAGEAVDTHEPLVRLVDRSRLFLVAHVSEFDLGALGPDPGALATLPGARGAPLDVALDLDGALVHTAPAVDPASRTVALRYDVANPGGVLRAGMYVDLELATGRSEDALAVPSTAVVFESGRPVAYAVLDGETFERRPLTLGLRDGAWVEVRSGLAAGDRVVVEGASLVRLAASGPAEFGHGHAH